MHVIINHKLQTYDISKLTKSFFLLFLPGKLKDSGTEFARQLLIPTKKKRSTSTNPQTTQYPA